MSLAARVQLHVDVAVNSRIIAAYEDKRPADASAVVAYITMRSWGLCATSSRSRPSSLASLGGGSGCPMPVSLNAERVETIQPSSYPLSTAVPSASEKGLDT